MADETKRMLPKTRLTVMSKLASNQSLSVEERNWVNCYLSAMMLRPEKMQQRQQHAGDAEDIAQDVMLKVVNSIRDGKFDPSHGSLQFYVLECLKNEIYSRHRNEVAAKRIPSEKLYSRDGLESADKVCENEEGNLEECGDGCGVQIGDDIVRNFVKYFREVYFEQFGGWHPETKEIIRYYIFDGHTPEETAVRFGKKRAEISDIQSRYKKWTEQQAKKYEDHPSQIVRELYRYCKDAGVFMIK